MEWKYWGEPFAKAYMESEGKHKALRIAHGIKKAVEMMPIYLTPEQVIAGNTFERSIVSYSFGAGISVDNSLAQRTLEIEKDENIKEEICKILNYFKDEVTIDRIRNTFTEEEKKSGFMRVFWAGEWGGHTLLNYKALLQCGTVGLKEKIKQRMQLTVDKLQHDWLESLIVICEAFELFASRYCNKARECLITAEDPLIRSELGKIIESCSRVPLYPAKTWRDALQCFWFAFVFDGVDSPGRFDQYMYPYLKHSLDIGEIELCEAQRLLEKLWVHFESVRAWNLCISGQTPEGQDATNELSYMILEVAKKYRFQAPNLTMRCHRNTPNLLWGKAIEVIKTGIGMPALYNDEVLIPALQRFGIPLEDARNYAMNGCNQIDIQGKSYMGLEDGELNLLKCLELALNQGRCRLTGEKLGIDTGDPRLFSSFDEVIEAYKSQVAYFTKMLTEVANKSQRVYAQDAPNPFRSLLIEGCIEKARDFRDGGPIYNHGQVLAEGIANTTDSLAVIKKLVFDEGKITMEMLMDALDKNFEGYDNIRRLILNKCNFYCNDNDYVDTIASEVVNHFFTELMKYNTYRGGIYGGGCSTFTRAPIYGRNVGATPDGRYALSPVCDSAGASQGKDKTGPTALLNSVSKVDLSYALSGYVVNVKFEKSIFNSASVIDKFEKLIKTYFQNGGQQVQVNVINSEELRAAKENPEKYKNLVVRVGGFSAYFSDLDEALQDDIINRTSYIM